MVICQGWSCFRKVWSVCTTNHCPCKNVWCTLNASQWLVLQVQSQTCDALCILCNCSLPNYNFWCVKLNYPSHCDGQFCHSENLTSDIGFLERKLYLGHWDCHFLFQSCGSQSLHVSWTEVLILFAMEKMTIFCFEFICTQVLNLKNI